MKPPRQERVVWIPSHPAQGAISMQRYWAALKAAAEGMGMPVGATLGEPVIPVTAAGKLRRAYEIYWRYPRRCRRILGERKVEVVHLLDHSFAHLLPTVPKGCKTVVTVHDLIPLREPGEMAARQVERFRGRMEYLRQADRVVAVSGSTRDDLIELLGISEERILVIPNGVTPRGEVGPEDGGVTALLGRFGDERFTVLSIGLAVGRKNLGVLPDVFRAYSEGGGRKALLVRVGDPLPERLRGELEGVLGVAGVIECGRVGDGELASLYGRADALIFPSTFEGFGLPVLEAMAAGCPVVASGIPSHREVGGDCVEYFAPDDPWEAGRALVEISAGGDEVSRRVAGGMARAKEFTWERHVGRLFGVYEEVVAGN